MLFVEHLPPIRLCRSSFDDVAAHSQTRKKEIYSNSRMKCVSEPNNSRMLVSHMNLCEEKKKKEKKIALANICIHHRIYLWETYIHNMVLGI